MKSGILIVSLLYDKVIYFGAIIFAAVQYLPRKRV